MVNVIMYFRIFICESFHTDLASKLPLKRQRFFREDPRFILLLGPQIFFIEDSTLIFPLGQQGIFKEDPTFILPPGRQGFFRKDPTFIYFFLGDKDSS